MGVNNETLYLKIEQNTIVFDRHVVLNDIAKMECTNEAVLRQLKQKKIYSFTNQKDEKKEKNTTKPVMGIFKKAGVNPQRFVKELRVDSVEGYELGQEIKVDVLAGVEFVDITGTSKGKGTSGVMKRHGFGGNRASHGVSRNHRLGGSIGMSTWPGKVLKGKRMAGQYGNETVTVQNLKVVKVDAENNLLLIKGAVPGSKNSYIVVKPAVKK